MYYFPQPVAAVLTGLMLFSTACTTFEDNAVATDSTVVGLEAEVVAQEKAVQQTRQQARRARELLKARQSQLDAARHSVRAREAVK